MTIRLIDTHRAEVLMDATTVEPRLFRTVLGHFPTGVTVITAARADGSPAGLTIGSFFSVSLEPPLVGFCVGKSSTTWPLIRVTGAFCANVLAGDQGEVCRQLAQGGEDKFRGVAWDTAPTGSPRIDGVLAWIDCEIDTVHDAGDHEICIGRVRTLAVERDSTPYVFFRGTQLGY
ncbi:flavin reductase family protein [Dactylosporangium sp. NPDC051484]|uniref:flavin reductase family protein n=1 Tax=Dactylosporangium sp. NPDC051484 TaxID=3154942 RepID=UPI00344B344D